MEFMAQESMLNVPGFTELIGGEMINGLESSVTDRGLEERALC